MVILKEERYGGLGATASFLAPPPEAKKRAKVAV
jgi:hypothetical protein